MINVLIFDEHDLLRDGIKSLLNEIPDVKVIAEASNEKEVRSILIKESVELMIIGINFNDRAKIEMIEFIKAEFKYINILMLSIHDNEEMLNRCIKAGVLGYILKNSKKEEFLNAVKLVSMGLPYISHQISINFIKKISKVSSDIIKTSVKLSERELEILGLIAEGYTNGEIANMTFTSKRTIETHRKNLLEKTGAKNSASLIKFALVNDLIKSE